MPSLFLPLVTGGTLVIYESTYQERVDLAVSDVFDDPRLDIVKLTPAHLSLVQDIDAAAADENADARAFAQDVGLCNGFFHLGQGVAGRCQHLTGCSRSRTGIHYGLGDVFGTLKGATGKNAGS